jgi:alkanesulfonate monooxygenase SsuD/methylene tetrahydromethanopterin reductase-like flavin-dependent oxidoreductase (luciferase family)
MTGPGARGTMAEMAEAGNRLSGTGLVLRDPLPWNDEREIVRTAEDTGYSAVFVPEIAAREAFATLAAFAGTTSRMSLGTGVVTMWARSPIITAMGAATVHELSEGRAILGIGAGSPPPGAPFLGQIDRLRAYVDTVRVALSGEAVAPDDPFGGTGFELGVDLQLGPPPIWLGALGDGMVRLGGEIADGIVLNWCILERVASARKLLDESADRAGRNPAAITVAVYVRACLGVSESVALDALRGPTGMYAAIPHYLRQLRQMGLKEEGEAAANAFRDGRPDLVPESLVRKLAVIGGRREALERFKALRDAGADLVLCYPVAARDPFSSIMGTVLTAAPEPAIER